MNKPMKEGKDTGRKRRGLFPGLLFAVLFGAAALVCAWKVADYLIDERKSLDYWGELQDSVIIMDADEHTQAPDRNAEHSPAVESQEPDAEETEPGDPLIPAAVDFDSLRAISEDAVAWLFSPNTAINYVIAQSDDNAYYLRRLLDGKSASGGTLFADYRCSADFSDWNTVVYGHQMNNGTMFGSLTNYRDPAYYEEHPVMYLYTPGKRYRLELIAGYTTDIHDIVYSLPAPRKTRDEILAQAMKKSSFQSGVAVGGEDRLVTLSTCAYDYDNARYVVITRIAEENLEDGFFEEHGFAEN